jgi:hypothetical protein
MRKLERLMCLVLAFTFVIGLAGCKSNSRLSHEKLAEFFNGRGLTKYSDSNGFLAACSDGTAECEGYISCKDAESQAIFDELVNSYKQETGAKVTETTACVLSQEQINGFYLVFLFSFENANSASEFYNYNASAFAGTVTGEEKDYSYSYTVNNVSGDMYQMNCFYLADNQVMYITGWSTELDFVNSICSTMDVVSPFQQ